MPTLLANNADVLVTMDEDRREIAGGGLFARDGVIEAVGPTTVLPTAADEILDLAGHIVTPGLINTHHHFYQNLTRAVPAGRAGDAVRLAEDALSRLGSHGARRYPHFGPGSTRRTGAVRHHLLVRSPLHVPQRIAARRRDRGGGDGRAAPARDPRRHEHRRERRRPAARPSGRKGGGHPGGLPAGHRQISRSGTGRHDPHRRGPLFAVFRLSGTDARCGPPGPRPGRHDAYPPGRERRRHRLLYRPLRMPSGRLRRTPRLDRRRCVARPLRQVGRWRDQPFRRYRHRRRPLPVGLGVDGSASNDCGSLLAEARMAMLLQRVALGGDAVGAREALEIATLGGAQVLGRDDLGALAPGKRADFAAFDGSAIDMAGAWDKVAGLLLCGPPRARHTVVDGRFVFRDGRMITLDLPAVLERHGERTKRLITG